MLAIRMPYLIGTTLVDCFMHSAARMTKVLSEATRNESAISIVQWVEKEENFSLAEEVLENYDWESKIQKK